MRILLIQWLFYAIQFLILVILWFCPHRFRPVNNICNLSMRSLQFTIITIRILSFNFCTAQLLSFGHSQALLFRHRVFFNIDTDMLLCLRSFIHHHPFYILFMLILLCFLTFSVSPSSYIILFRWREELKFFSLRTIHISKFLHLELLTENLSNKRK